MTRENKLSIVIAFGLLIFVGMLIADHYSIASHRTVAELGSNVPPPPLRNTGKLVDGPPSSAATVLIASSAGDTLHVVVQGETLRSICSAYYGDSGLAGAVAKWNSILNPDNIEPGVQIALPTRPSLISGSFSLPAPNQIAKASEQHPTAVLMATYTVRKGDTLSEIAQKLMGTMKKTQLLIEINVDVMPNPNRIRPGMVLRYPVTSH